MNVFDLECTICKRKFPARLYYKCECGGILEVKYNTKPSKSPKPHKTMWDYSAFLPLEHKANIITLQEGLTPSVVPFAFVAVGIAQAPMMKTAMTAWRLALPIFLLAYAFVFNPSLLLLKKSKEK